MSVRDAYDRWAVQYDDNRNRTRDLNMQCLRRANLPLAGARVFEAGCGTGLNTEFLAGQGARVTAMDFSESPNCIPIASSPAAKLVSRPTAATRNSSSRPGGIRFPSSSPGR